ncbi:MAG TPA: transposase [Burkholderiaceae bacterium]|nr:transposase [Burkholderiaceae bacterium]
MPDHMHILLTLGASESLPHLMRRIKSVTSRQARRAAPCSQPLWADAYHDRAIRRDEDIARARYIIANPVRAGLVETPWAWPFWDSQWPPDHL